MGIVLLTFVIYMCYNLNIFFVSDLFNSPFEITFLDLSCYKFCSCPVIVLLQVGRTISCYKIIF